VDTIPCIGLADNLDQFLRKSRCEKLGAYVVPTCETDEKTDFPRNKSEMLKLAKNRIARLYHQET
jgi:hypothetical protein